MHHVTNNTDYATKVRVRQIKAQQRPSTCTRTLQLLCTLMLCFMLTACAGYTLIADAPSVLGDGSKTIKIKGVENPTMYANLPYIVRTDVRNEMAARNLAVWRDSGPTDYTLQIRITRLTLRRWGGLEEDTKTIFTSTMGMEFVVYNGKTNSIVWRSGVRTYNENLDSYEEGLAIEESSQRLTEELLDLMRQDF